MNFLPDPPLPFLDCQLLLQARLVLTNSRMVDCGLCQSRLSILERAFERLVARKLLLEGHGLSGTLMLVHICVDLHKVLVLNLPVLLLALLLVSAVERLLMALYTRRPSHPGWSDLPD